MEKKKVLIVSRSFHPENSPRSFRTTELVKELCRQGHDVTLYTIKDDEQQQPLVKQFGFTLKDLGKMRWKNFTITGRENKITFPFIYSYVCMREHSRTNANGRKKCRN